MEPIKVKAEAVKVGRRRAAKPAKSAVIAPVILQSQVKKTGGSMKDKVVPVLVVLLIAAAFAVGMLYGKVSVYEKTGGVATTGTTGQNQPTGDQTAQAQPTKATVSLNQIKTLFASGNIVFGDANKKVLFAEFSDPSCPYCQVAAGKNADLNNQMGGQFKMVADGGTYVAPVPEMRKLIDSGKAGFVWVYFPGHGNGEMGTRALYCGYKMNKFWEVHDLLMSSKGYDLLNNQVKNDMSKAGDLAQFLSSAVSASAMQTCLTSKEFDDRISKDTNTARTIGVSATPTFYVNSQLYEGAYSYKEMESTVQQAIGS